MSMNPHVFAFFGAVQTGKTEKWEKLQDTSYENNDKKIKVGFYNLGDEEYCYVTTNDLFFPVDQEDCKLITLPVLNLKFKDAETIVKFLKRYDIEVDLQWHIAIRWG